MRVYRFEVVMKLQDDDQSDPEDMVSCIQDVLNGEPAANAAWQEMHDDLVPEYLPKFEVHYVEK